jgi:hypothetical protein
VGRGEIAGIRRTFDGKLTEAREPLLATLTSRIRMNVRDIEPTWCCAMHVGKDKNMDRRPQQ